MITVRAVLVVVGVVLGAYGTVLLWDNPPVIIIRILVWALVGVVLHDLVFAPLCVVLVFLAIPVYGKPGMRPDNMTVLDRNYPLGLWISLAIVWACVPLYYLAKRLLQVRQDEVVQQQGADDVERQPPAG